MTRVDSQARYGSDVMADMLRLLDIKYAAMMPGSSYRGLHDSIVNYLGNNRPEVILCADEGIAVALAKQEWRVIVNYRRNSAAAAETVQMITEAGGQAHAIQADIAEATAREHMIEQIQSTVQRLDLLVNNAGMAPRQRADLLTTTEASYDEVMAANLKGPFFLTQRVANLMIALLENGAIKNPKIINLE